MDNGLIPSTPEQKNGKRRNFIVAFIYYLIFFALSVLFVRYALPHLWAFVLALIVVWILHKPAFKLSKKLKIDYRTVSVILVILFYGTIGLLLFLIVLKLVGSSVRFIGDLPDLVKDEIVPYIKETFAGIQENIDALEDKIGINFNINLFSKAVETASGAIAGSGTAVESGAVIDSAAIAGSGAIADGGTLTNDLSGIIESLTSALVSFIGDFSKSIINSAPSIASSFSSVIVNVVVCIVSTAFGLMDYDLITAWIKKQLSAPRAKFFGSVTSHLGRLVGKYVASYSLIMIITFCELAVGLLIIFKSPAKAFGLAAIIAIFDILPIIGSGLFLCPWAIISLLSGEIGHGIGLFILWFVLIIVRNIMEPKIVGNHVGMHPLVTLMAMIGGQFIYGGIGIILVPVALALTRELNNEGVIRIYKRLTPEDYTEPEHDKITEFFSGLTDKVSKAIGYWLRRVFRKTGAKKKTAEKTEKKGKTEKAVKTEKTKKTEKSEKAEKTGKAGKAEKAGKKKGKKA